MAVQRTRTCGSQVGVEVGGKGFLVHLLQADDVGVEAQQLRHDERSPVVGVQEPAAMEMQLFSHGYESFCRAHSSNSQMVWS